MFRTLTLAAAAVAVLPAAAAAKRAPALSPVEKVAAAGAVFVGKVTALEKDPVMLPRHPGDPNKVAHTVAVVKVETGLLGAEKGAEFKVAFAPPVAGRPVRGFPPVDLTAGQEGLFFLARHPGGDYHAVNPMAPPLDPKAANYKAQLEVVTRAAAALADPAKALKAEKPEDRFLAATALVTRYRTPPDGVETEVVKVPAEESKLILKALTEGDWSKYDLNAMNGAQAFHRLGLTAKDGWVPPVVANTPGAPPVDFGVALRDAFTKWVDGPGKDYQINRIAPKAKK